MTLVPSGRVIGWWNVSKFLEPLRFLTQGESYSEWLLSCLLSLSQNCCLQFSRQCPFLKANSEDENNEHIICSLVS